jgi:hypothetical protein
VITPAVPVMLAGFSDRSEPAKGVHDDLEARAVWLDDGTRAACLLVLDLLGLSEEFAGPVRDAVARDLGIDREAVLTAATHTHNGPNAIRGGELLGWAIPEGYGDLLVERCRDAAAAARDAAEEATLHAVTAPLPEGLSLNRRGLPYDPRFSVLDLRRPAGERIGIVANASIHPVLLGSPWLQVSADWVGSFRVALEAEGGGTAVLLSGPLGDVNPVEHHEDPAAHLAEAAAEATELGAAVAGAVAGAAGGASPVTGSLQVASRSLTVAPGETTLAGLLGVGEVTVELIEWAIGDVRLVSVPGEPFHALGRRIEAARPGVTLIAGLAPVWSGYLPEPYGEGYEETVSLGPDAVRAIADAVVEGAFQEASA